jgi:predicted Fe-S protein YdhL (DUF1289 family)
VFDTVFLTPGPREYQLNSSHEHLFTQSLHDVHASTLNSVHVARRLVAAAPPGHATSMPPPRPIVSPCVLVCTMDAASGLCLGCRRSLEEIARWARLSEAERDRVMAELPSRRAGGEAAPRAGG